MEASAGEPVGATPDRDDPRFHRLLEVTRQAAAKGYDAVSMRDLAREAKMSLNTVYRFCSSKDQLIAEAHAERMDDFRKALDRRPPRGATAEKRVQVVLRGIAGALERDEVVTRTLMRAIYSGAGGVAAARQAATGSYKDMVDAAIADAPVADREAVIETLGHVINSVVLSWLNGQMTATEAGDVLADAAHVMLGR